ncbi:unnamed protein product [Fraxinus pennsylvanica]|uniref:Aminotransferase-like plant mobile domain-containing protein n=1 Tax=Fraxinus pennsylvanica TaxID=56036 RepID=A0AAD2AFN3_9LAMI|nr:unnamed protein product [Fraxinus pennsylvanica]
MNCGSKIEHEAFLAHWLSRFVFPVYDLDTIGRNVLPIAVRLARGIKLALAPAVLATIYKNLSSLKGALVASRKLETRKGKNVFEVKLTAPLQLIQAWVWERFLALRPKPNSTKLGEPRLARWHDLKKVGTMNVLLAIDRAAKDFTWRPYMRAENSSLPHMTYKEKEYWVLVDSCLGDEFEGLVRCLRTSELVGLEVGCIEQYLPHRVAMQFGMDQDVPGCVARVNERTDIAWSNYTRTIGDAILYIPARLFESDVTTRYMKWWKKLRFTRSGMTETRKEGKSTSRGPKIEEMKGFYKMKSVDDALASPSGLPPKSNSMKAGVSGIKDNNTVRKKEEINGIRLPQKDAQRISLSSANDGTMDDFHEHGISEKSKREVMVIISGKKSDKDGTTKAGSEVNDTPKGYRREEMEGFFKVESVDDVLAPPPDFPTKPNSMKAGVSDTKDNIVGKFFKEESDGMRLLQKGAQRKNTLSCANDGTKDDFHGHGISEISKREVMEIISGKKSDKDGSTKAGSDGTTMSKGSKREEMEGFFKMKSVEDVLAPPPGFPPKTNSMKAGVSCIKDNSIVGKNFKEESNGIRLTQKDAQRKSTSSCTIHGTKDDFHGHDISERSKNKVTESLSGKKSVKVALVPPPPDFSPKRTRVEAGDSGFKDKETGVEMFVVESDVNSQPQDEPAEPELENECAGLKKSWLDAVNYRSEEHAESCCQTTLEAPGMGLEERICTIEKLCAWLKAGNCCLGDI